MRKNSNFGIKYSNELKQGKNPVWFMSEGFKLAGNIFMPMNFEKGKKYPTIVTVTPAGGVKEQTAGLYAEKLSALGYITLAFDHRTFGESEGFPRYREDPFMKVYDVKHAITFMNCIEEVDADKLALLGICSGGGYAAYTGTFDIRVKTVATVSAIFDFAGWGRVLYGDFNELLQKSAEARKKFYLTGEADYVDAWYGETTPVWEDRDQFWGQATQYYREGGSRGGYEVTNGDHRDTQCIDNRYMMNVNPMLKHLAPRPLLAIRGEIALTGPLSDEAVSFTEKGAGELFVIPKASHIDLYHVEDLVNQAVDKMKTFYADNM